MSLLLDEEAPRRALWRRAGRRAHHLENICKNSFKEDIEGLLISLCLCFFGLSDISDVNEV